MKCPIDGSELVIAERTGIEIDYCPKCRGVWLDRGELDKIIERSLPQAAPPRAAESYRPEKRRDDDDGHYRKKKRRGFLEDLFDFD
ncbi:zf-TFIIB domain-containing protein [Mameliella alba]|nr:zf-TFIIB domain-containing protein [Antarctobacter heliothermus]MBY6143142.1 zf-TFIIB domain-containing protein [Mameliella alba]MBY6159997.1 zf-TFIIB domain-containing protein [Mameliella alba]MBY6168468.1 zf-TFIIB domain-containing protein [Mameliella alba]MBY6173488.1 zf-TFIIB domain-containing protein [Mameliella alba]